MLKIQLKKLDSLQSQLQYNTKTEIDSSKSIELAHVIDGLDIGKVTENSYKEHLYSKEICSYKIGENDPIKKFLTQEDNITPCNDSSISELQNMELKSIQVLHRGLLEYFKIVYISVSQKRSKDNDLLFILIQQLMDLIIIIIHLLKGWIYNHQRLDDSPAWTIHSESSDNYDAICESSRCKYAYVK